MPISSTLANLAPAAGGLLGGALFGPVGAAGGALAGTGFGDILRDYYKTESPQDQMMAQLLQQYQTPYNFQRESFDPIAKGEIRRFENETLPSIIERFEPGGQRSSAFAQLAGLAGSDLNARLAEMQSRHNLGQQQEQRMAFGENRARMSDLAGILGSQQAQQQALEQARQNRYGNLASMIPETMLGVGRLQTDRELGLLGKVLSGLGEKRGLQEGRTSQANQTMQSLMGQYFDTIRGRQPTALERLGMLGGRTLEEGGNLLKEFLMKKIKG